MKLKFALPISILPATALISLLSFTPQPAYPQTISPIISFWNKIFKSTRRDPEPPIKPVKGVSRPGQTLCIISPDRPSQTSNIPRIIWNTKPFFLWKGEAVKKIAVTDINANPNSKKYFKTKIVTGTQTANYTGQPLEPGQTYELQIFISEHENASAAMPVPFQIMEASQHTIVTNDLRLLEMSHKNKDAETIALAKANYFANKGLWLDALQQIYSVPNPSPEMYQVIKDLPDELCK